MEDGANLQCSESVHDFIRAWVAYTVLERKLTALFDGKLSVPVAQIDSLPLLDFFFRGWDEVLQTAFNDLLPESDLATRELTPKLLVEDLLLHGVQILQYLVVGSD